MSWELTTCNPNIKCRFFWSQRRCQHFCPLKFCNYSSLYFYFFFAGDVICISQTWKVKFSYTRSEVAHFDCSRDHSVLMCAPHPYFPQPQIAVEPSWQPDQRTTLNQIIFLGYFLDNVSFVQGSTLLQELIGKRNVKLYPWWTTQSHTAKEQTQPAALLCTHHISLSVLSRRLQFPKGSCIPVHNLHMYLPVRHWSSSLHYLHSQRL